MIFTCLLPLLLFAGSTFVPEPEPLPKIPGPSFTVVLVDKTVLRDAAFMVKHVRVKVRYGVLDVPIGDLEAVQPRTRVPARDIKEAEESLKELVNKKSVTAFQSILRMGRAGRIVAERFLEDEANQPKEEEIELVTSLFLEMHRMGIRIRKTDDIDTTRRDQIAGELVDATIPFLVDGQQVNVRVEDVLVIRRK